LGLALDEQKDNDKIFDGSGLTFLVEDGLFERTKPLKIDYVSSPMGSGFSISSSMKPAAGCGTSCSC
jgi:Fe-S cluster assembly iron-binding protein IscA